jgi:hypothetical protein
MIAFGGRIKALESNVPGCKRDLGDLASCICYPAIEGDPQVTDH